MTGTVLSYETDAGIAPEYNNKPKGCESEEQFPASDKRRMKQMSEN